MTVDDVRWVVGSHFAESFVVHFAEVQRSNSNMSIPWSSKIWLISRKTLPFQMDCSGINFATSNWEVAKMCDKSLRKSLTDSQSISNFESERHWTWTDNIRGSFWKEIKVKFLNENLYFTIESKAESNKISRSGWSGCIIFLLDCNPRRVAGISFHKLIFEWLKSNTGTFATCNDGV